MVHGCTIKMMLIVSYFGVLKNLLLFWFLISDLTLEQYWKVLNAHFLLTLKKMESTTKTSAICAILSRNLFLLVNDTSCFPQTVVIDICNIGCLWPFTIGHYPWHYLVDMLFLLNTCGFFFYFWWKRKILICCLFSMQRSCP